MSDMAGIAGNAVSVYQQALTTVSNNIANVSTEGYSRQDVKLNALPVTLVGNIFLGSGVQVERVQRQYNEFVERNLRNTVSDLAAQEPMVSYTNRVVDIMGGQSMGLSSALDQFFLAGRALSGDASSTVMRGAFLREAEGITERFSQLSAQLDLVEVETLQSLESAVGQINGFAADLALVNKQLTKEKSEDAQPADLLDQRDLLLKKLSQFARVNTQFTPNGTVKVSLGSTINLDVLVDGNFGYEIKAISDPTSDKVSLILNPYGKPRSLSGITSGSLAGLISFREEVMGSTRNTLNGLAQTFAKEINAVHQQGIDGYGNVGKELFSFDPAKFNAAAGMRVAFDDPMRISSAAQFRVVDGASNPSGTSASIAYLDSASKSLARPSGPTDITKALANGAYSSSPLVVNPTVSVPIASIASIAHGMSDVEIYLDSNQPGQQLAVLTRDGRQLIGASMAEAYALRGQLMTTSNGFAAGASYSDAYLNGARQSVALSGLATGTQSFLGVAVTGSASGNTAAQSAARIVANKATVLAGSQAISAGVTDIQLDPDDSTKLILVTNQTSPVRTALTANISAGISFGNGLTLKYKDMNVFYGAQATVKLQPIYNDKDVVIGNKVFVAELAGGRVPLNNPIIPAGHLVLNGASLDAIDLTGTDPYAVRSLADSFNRQTAKTGVTALPSNTILINQDQIKFNLPLYINDKLIETNGVFNMDGIAAAINNAFLQTYTWGDGTTSSWQDLEATITADRQLQIKSQYGADVRISASRDGSNTFINALGINSGIYRGQISLTQPSAHIAIIEPGNINYNNPLVINGVAITKSSSVNSTVRNPDDTFALTTGTTSALQLAQLINKTSYAHGISSHVSTSGQLILSNQAGYEDADLWVSATLDDESSAANALGLLNPRSTVGGATVVGPIKASVNQTTNLSPIQLGFGPAGSPADLTALGFRTGAFISGAAKDDLLVFATGAGIARVTASYAGKPVDAKQTLRAQNLQVVFKKDTDPKDPNTTLSYTISSTDPATGRSTVVAKRYFDDKTLNPGIVFQGLQLSFTAPPGAGDVFDLDGNKDGIGNNDNMLDLVALEKASLVGNKTLANSYIDHINNMGNVAIAAQIAQTALTVVRDQAVSTRDDLAGVSLDKEAVDLIRYQQAYQAAAKALQTAISLFDSILQVR